MVRKEHRESGRRAMRRTVAGGFLLAVFLPSCSRPTVAEVNAELTKMVEPVLRKALANSDHNPERLSGEDACSDPFVGPRQGVRPGIEIRIPFEALGDEPESLALDAAKVWRDM